MVTTIQLKMTTKQKLGVMKETPRQTYEEVVERLIELAKEDTAELSKKTKKQLSRAREDIKKGHVLSTPELIRELGI